MNMLFCTKTTKEKYSEFMFKKISIQCYTRSFTPDKTKKMVLT